MDSIDQNILDLLSKNSRMTATAISKTINLSVPAVTERIKNLEETNIIEYYTLKTNLDIMGYNLHTFIFVSIDNTEYTNIFREEIIKFDEVLECHHIAGEYDYLLKVVVKDTSALESFISCKLKHINGVSKSNTLFRLSTLKHTLNRRFTIDD